MTVYIYICILYITRTKKTRKTQNEIYDFDAMKN